MRKLAWVLTLVACGRTEPLAEHASNLTVGVEYELVAYELGDPPNSQIFPTVAAGPSDFMVVWHDRREQFGGEPLPPNQLYSTRVSSSGVVREPVGRRLPPALAAGKVVTCDNGNTCLVFSTASNFTQLQFVRVVDGQIANATPTIIDAGSIASVNATFDGSAFRVVWSSNQITPQRKIASIDVAGNVGAPTAIGTGFPGGFACEGARCLMLFMDQPQQSAFAQLVGPAGLIGSPVRIFGPTGRIFPTQLVWDGTQYWIGMMDQQNPVNEFDRRIVVARISADGALLGSTEVLPANLQEGPVTLALGHDGTNAVLVWRQTRQFGVDAHTRGVRLDPNGTVLDPGGAVIAGVGPNLGDLACRAGTCLQTFTNDTIVGVRLAGVTPLDSPPLAIAASPSGQTRPAIGPGPGGFLAVWHDSRRPSQHLFGAVFSATTPPVGFSIGNTVCPPRPAIAGSSTGYLVAFRQRCSEPPDGEQDRVGARLIRPDGQPIGNPFDASATVIASNGTPAGVAVASNGTRFLMVWDTRNADDTQNTIRGIQFAGDGTPIPAQHVEIAPTGQFPSLAFTGSQYLMTIQRNDPTTGADVIVIPISQSGVVGGDIDLARTTRRDEAPSIACAPSGCVVAWIANSSQVRIARIAGTTILDPGGRVIATVSGIEKGTQTVFDGSTFEVAWRVGDAFFVAHVAQDGTVAAPPAPIPSPTPMGHVELASNGTDTMMIYDRLDLTDTYTVRRVRVRSTTPLTAPTPRDAGVEPSQPDAALPDAALPDAARPDAALPDAALPDATVADAAVPDAAVPDAGMLDAATPVDAPQLAPPNDGGCASGSGATGGALALVILSWCYRRSSSERTRRRSA